MKKTLSLSFAILMVAASCSREMFEPAPVLGDQTGKVSMTFRAVADDTKANLEGLSFQWQVGDTISVWDGKNNNKFRAVEVSGRSATFYGEAYDTTNYTAVFPYKDAYKFKDGEQIINQMNVPAKQTIEAGKSLDSRALTCVAVAGEDKVLSFQNICGLIKITVPVAGVRQITFKSNQSADPVEKLAGNFTINMPNDETPYPTVNTDVNAVANLNIFPADGTFEAGQTIYAAVLPRTYTAGMVVSLSKEDEQAFRTTKKDLTVRRNGGVDLGTGLFDGAVWLSDNISTKEQFLAFAEFASFYPADKTICLDSDIDLGVGEMANVKVFGEPVVDGMKCSFDGQNHCISGFLISPSSNNVGFFGNISGTVSNLVFGSRDGVSYDETSEIVYYGGSAAGWYNVAPIAQTSGSVINVKNYAKVTIESDATTPTTRIAGVVAYVTGNDVEITNCHNYSEIFHNAMTKTEQQIGGVICSVNSDRINIRGCENHADVIYGEANGTNGTKFVTSMGGVISVLSKNTRKSTVENCKNYGMIANNSINGPGIFSGEHKECIIGGVIGRANGLPDGGEKSNNYTGLENHGTVYSSSNTVVLMGGVIGRSDAGNIITGCLNDAEVSYDADNAIKTIEIGGIVGKAWDTTISECVNDGEVTTNKFEINRVGGIAGTVDYSRIIDCVNNAAVTNNGCVVAGSARAFEQLAGGIVGLAENNEKDIVISGCTNNGAVTASIFCNQGDIRHAAAGIVAGIKVAAISGGSGSGAITVSGNTNTAAVSISNKAPKGIVVAGILGLDTYGVANGDRNPVEMSGNVNTGDLSLETLHPSTQAALHEIGGIAGRTDYVNSTGDKSVCTIVNNGNMNEANQFYGQLAKTNNVGAAFGVLKKGVISGVKVGGTIDGVALDEDNYESLCVGSITGTGTLESAELVAE